MSSHTPCVFSPRLCVTLCAQVGDEHKEPAVLLIQTELHLSYLLAKTDGVRTKRLTEKKIMCTKYFVFQAYSAMLHRGVPKQRCRLPGIVSKFQIQTDNETWKGVKLIARQMFPTSGLTEIIYIIPQLWLKRSALCYLRLPQAPS